MFSILKRIIQPAQFMIFFLCLFIAGKIYPPTRTYVNQLIDPYRTNVEVWGNILMSLLTALLIMGIWFFICGVVKGMMEELLNSHSTSSSTGIRIGKEMIFYSWVGMVNVILFTRFVQIKSVWIHWKGVYLNFIYQDLLPVVAVVVVFVVDVLKWASGIMITLGVLIILVAVIRAIVRKEDLKDTFDKWSDRFEAINERLSEWSNRK